MSMHEPERPWPNTYWVEPSRLLAGAYPGATTEQRTMYKLNALLDAGIRTFIDLTEDHELIRYDDVLDRIARERGLTVRYHRHPIRDVGVPRSRDDMHAILACIETSLRAGDPVYVHCWGGVGRTGTVIGCYLVSCGLSGDDALRQLAELFGAMEKSATKLSPEADDQERWVREWS